MKRLKRLRNKRKKNGYICGIKKGQLLYALSNTDNLYMWTGKKQTLEYFPEEQKDQIEVVCVACRPGSEISLGIKQLISVRSIKNKTTVVAPREIVEIWEAE